MYSDWMPAFDAEINIGGGIEQWTIFTGQSGQSADIETPLQLMEDYRSGWAAIPSDPPSNPAGGTITNLSSSPGYTSVILSEYGYDRTAGDGTGVGLTDAYAVLAEFSKLFFAADADPLYYLPDGLPGSVDQVEFDGDPQFLSWGDFAGNLLVSGWESYGYVRTDGTSGDDFFPVADPGVVQLGVLARPHPGPPSPLLVSYRDTSQIGTITIPPPPTPPSVDQHANYTVPFSISLASQTADRLQIALSPTNLDTTPMQPNLPLDYPAPGGRNSYRFAAVFSLQRLTVQVTYHFPRWRYLISSDAAGFWGVRL